MKAQLVIEHKRGRHIRRAKQDIGRVAACIGQNRRRGAQHPHQRVKKDNPQHAYARPEKQRRKKSGGYHARGVFHILPPQRARNIVARPMAEGKADGLDDRHQGKHHAHRTRSARADATDEKGIRHVVKRGDQHAGDGGHRQCADELFHRRFRHPLIFFCCCFFLFHAFSHLQITRPDKSGQSATRYLRVLV